jgi:hypothetical protein
VLGHHRDDGLHVGRGQQVRGHGGETPQPLGHPLSVLLGRRRCFEGDHGTDYGPVPALRRPRRHGLDRLASPTDRQRSGPGSAVPRVPEELGDRAERVGVEDVGGGGHGASG